MYLYLVLAGVLPQLRRPTGLTSYEADAPPEAEPLPNIAEKSTPIIILGDCFLAALLTL